MKKATRALAIILAATVLLFSPFAGFEVIFFIDAVGFDMFVMLLEAQLIVALGLTISRAKHAARYVHEWMMLHDPNYFIPTVPTIRAYPPMIIHAVPELLALPIITTMIIAKAIQFA